MISNRNGLKKSKSKSWRFVELIILMMRRKCSHMPKKKRNNIRRNSSMEARFIITFTYTYMKFRVWSGFKWNLEQRKKNDCVFKQRQQHLNKINYLRNFHIKIKSSVISRLSNQYEILYEIFVTFFPLDFVFFSLNVLTLAIYIIINWTHWKKKVTARKEWFTAWGKRHIYIFDCVIIKILLSIGLQLWKK